MIIEQVETFFSKLSKRERLLVIIAAVLVVLALMDMLVLGPILHHLNSVEGEINRKAAAIRRDLRILSFKEAILEEYAQYVRYMDSGEKSEEEIVAALLRKIETIASEKSVSISNVQPGDVLATSIFRVYKTSIAGQGALMNVLEFMYLLEESDYLFRVTKYELVPKSKGSEIVKFSLDIERVFITKEDVDVDAILAEQKKKESLTPQEEDQEEAGGEGAQPQEDLVMLDASTFDSELQEDTAEGLKETV